jgi:hypothetical protein
MVALAEVENPLIFDLLIRVGFTTNDIAANVQCAYNLQIITNVRVWKNLNRDILNYKT